MMAKIAGKVWIQECRRILVAGACAWLLLFTPLARGGGSDEAIDARAYDLERPEDVQKLYRLLKQAARSACSDRQIADTDRHTLSWLGCVGGMLDMEVQRIDRPTLTAYHLAHGFGIRDEPWGTRNLDAIGDIRPRENIGSQRARPSVAQRVGRSGPFGDCPLPACGCLSRWRAR